MTPRTDLPAAVADAVNAAARAFTSAIDAQYAAALGALTSATAALDPGARAQVNDLLASTAAALRAQEHVERVRAALHAGQLRSVRVVPGGVEVLEVTGAGMEQVILTVPTVLATDSPQVRTQVDGARAALMEGACARCGETLAPGVGNQLELNHTPGCPWSPQAITAARSR